MHLADFRNRTVRYLAVGGSEFYENHTCSLAHPRAQMEKTMALIKGWKCILKHPTAHLVRHKEAVCSLK